MKLLFRISIFLILLRTLTEYGNASGYYLPSLEAANKIIGVILVLLSVVTFKKWGLTSSNLGLKFSLTIFFLISVLNGLLNYPFDSVLASEIARIISILSVYSIGLHARYIDLNKLKNYLLIVCSIPGVILITSYFFGGSHFRIDANRATGTFSHPNSAAAYFGISAIVCLGLFLKSRKIYLIIMFIINIFSVILTQSMTSLIGTIFAISVMLLIDDWMTVRKKISLIGAISFLTLIFSFQFLNKISEIFNSDYRTILISGSNDTSIGWRILNWNLYFKYLEKSPFLGFGPGSSSHLSPLGHKPHSGLVQVIVEYGLVGMSVLFIAFLLFIRKSACTQRNFDPIMVIAYPLGSFLLVLSLTSNILSYTASLFLAALALGISNQRRSNPIEYQLGSKNS